MKAPLWLWTEGGARAPEPTPAWDASLVISLLVLAWVLYEQVRMEVVL